jgi:two-component system, chemotaxis family, protein-glutamate methylesterase/glutaminase
MTDLDDKGVLRVVSSRRPVSVVGLVLSTGGLEALKRILSQLPGTLPAAVIVLRHQAPRVGDLLAPLLRGSTRLRVTTARDGERIRPGQVFVVPAGHHTLVTPEGRLAVILSGGWPPYRPSADLLLTSMALSVGRRAVAVVLSGYGNDGATGATAVHHLGGVVVASDRATSTVFAMPSATIERDKIIDHVVPVDDIAPLLTKVVEARSAGRRPGCACSP